jgi:hypothetical protein
MGMRAFTLMPWSAPSIASERVRPSRPDFAIEYAAMPLLPIAALDAVISTRP